MSKFSEFFQDQQTKEVLCKICNEPLHGPVEIELGEMVIRRYVCDRGHIEEVRVD